MPRVVILILILGVYIVLGTFLEGFSMLVLTLPIVIPIMQALGYDLIWFGVIMVIVLEMGLIDPPVGINVFIVKGLVPDVPMSEIFAGILPFWLAMMVCIAHPDRVPGDRDVHPGPDDQVKRKSFRIVMAGRSPSKTGVNALMSRPSTS